MRKRTLGVVTLLGVACAVYFRAPEPSAQEASGLQDPALVEIPTTAITHPASRWAPATQCVGCEVHQDAGEPAGAPDTASLSAGAYQKQRMNVYFDAEEFVQDWLAMDEGLVLHLAEHLEKAPDIDDPSSFLGDQPPIALERMAHIDVLEQIARVKVTENSSKEAREALARIIEKDLPRDLLASQKRLMVGEKYDALTALARTAPEAAARVFAGLNSDGQKEALKGAILLALLDRGSKRDEVLADFGNLLAAVD